MGHSSLLVRLLDGHYVSLLDTLLDALSRLFTFDPKFPLLNEFPLFSLYFLMRSRALCLV